MNDDKANLWTTLYPRWLNASAAVKAVRPHYTEARDEQPSVAVIIAHGGSHLHEDRFHLSNTRLSGYMKSGMRAILRELESYIQ